jgi:hypothetical protein
MAQARVWTTRALFLLVFVMFLMVTTGAEAQTVAPAGQAKVDRLVMGLILPFRRLHAPVD